MTGQDEREVLAGILIEHTRMNIERCRCGWSDLGRSHARHVADAILAEGFHLTPTAVLEDAGPEAGHTFEVSVRSRGSGGVLDGPKSDANWWGDPSVVRVRAWNLPDAVARAATIPYHKWESAPTAEVKAEAWEEGYWQGINGHTGPGNPYREPNATHLRENGGAE